MLKTGWSGTSISIGAFSSVTRSAVVFAGIRAVLRLVELDLLYWTMTVPPLPGVLQQPLVVGAQILAALVGAHAE